MLHALMNVADADSLLSQPWVGASWEGFAIEQILGEVASKGLDCHPYYFRTSDGYELDLVLDFGRERWAVEVKLTASPSAADMDRLTKTADMIAATRRFLVSRTAKSSGDDHRASLNLSAFAELISRLSGRLL